MLQKTEDDFEFYEGQKGPRKAKVYLQLILWHLVIIGFKEESKKSNMPGMVNQVLHVNQAQAMQMQPTQKHNYFFPVFSSSSHSP